MKALRDLLILGVSVHAFEMVEIVRRVNRAQRTWNLLGFISPDEAAVGAAHTGYSVLGTHGDLSRYPGAGLVPTNDWPHDLPLPREQLASLVDPSTFVSPTAQIGGGCVLYPNGFVGHDARLGERVFCLSGCVINHDNVLEDGVVLASNVSLAGFVRVEAGCYLGQACTVRQHVTIGRGSLVGMGSVVLQDVPPNAVVVGNPAQWLRPNR